MARPTKLTKKRLRAILEPLRAGGTRKAAAASAGVGESTLHDWLRAARGGGTSLQGELLIEVERAEAQAEARATGVITAAVEGGDWKAAAWWLERRRRADWGRQLLEVGGEPDAPQTWAALVMLAEG